MSSSPYELQKRCDAFSAKWQNFRASPGTDPLLEFVVSVSSFTEYLHSKGLSGLHQISRSLEQQVLALFDARECLNKSTDHASGSLIVAKE